MAHPLNRAVYDPRRGRVVRGYGILQPRVGVSLPSAHRSQFAAIHSGHPGVDPYTTAVSDVYQDLYGEGSFTGKGIYDVDAFERATHGRFPENTLLSHDLIEGNYARAGLATDIEVYDDYPTRYLTFTRRKHRWIRGDWQLLRWLTSTRARARRPRAEPALAALALEDPRQPAAQHRRDRAARVPRSPAGRCCRARRSAGRLLGARRDRGALAGRAAARAAPAAARQVVARLLRGRGPRRRDQRCSSSALAITFLPHQAWVSADAIVRTLWRLCVAQRQLLEWQTASQTERARLGRRGAAWRTMWPAVALPLRARWPSPSRWRALGGQRVDSRRSWARRRRSCCSGRRRPPIAHALSAPARATRAPAARRRAGRRRMRYALLHWRYFERFVTEETHWLAPDNFQEDPEPVVAMRTSPTNIGLQLLATVSALRSRLHHARRT